MSIGVVASHGVVSSASYSSVVLGLVPLVYWKLDETSGTNAADSSGNSRAATYTNTPTVGAASLLTDNSGHAMGVAANTGQCTTIASAAWMNTSFLTVTCLVNLSSAVDSGNGDAIVSRYASGGFNWLLWRRTDGKWGGQVSNQAGSTVNVTGSASVVNGTKYHLGMTWDGTTIRLYEQGTQTGTAALSGTALFNGATPIEIGRYSAAANTTPGGSIDEVSVWGTALTATDMASLAAAA